jgi:uncharacterized integral membrane protein
VAERTRGRDTGEIARVVAVLVLVGLLVAFVIDNAHSVKVGFVFGDRHPLLIWVLVVTAVLGALLDRLAQILWRRRK